MIKDIAFVGYPVKDIAKAREFYEGVLGLTPSEEYPVTDESRWVEYNIGNSTISIGKMDGWVPSKDGPTMALDVDNIEEMLKKLKEKNVEIVLDLLDFPNCSTAMIRDVDGNSITLHHKK